MCWNFNGCGDFCGGDFGAGDYIIEVGGSGLEVAQRVDFGGVGCGRAWVSSLPNFFLGKYFQFWKLPPLFCINNKDNVYYPIFLTGNGFHFFIEKWQKMVWNMAGHGQRTDVLWG